MNKAKLKAFLIGAGLGVLVHALAFIPWFFLYRHATGRGFVVFVSPVENGPWALFYIACVLVTLAGLNVVASYARDPLLG